MKMNKIIWDHRPQKDAAIEYVKTLCKGKYLIVTQKDIDDLIDVIPPKK